MPCESALPADECLDRGQLAERQHRRLARLLRHVHGHNPFYTRKLDAAGLSVEALGLPDDLSAIPMTTKAELVEDQDDNPPWGTTG